MNARALFVFCLVNAPTAAVVLTRQLRRPEVTRSGRVMAYDDTPILTVRDALITRAVEQQVSSFALIHDMARKAYLHEQWEQFLKRSQPTGSLTSFIGHLQRSEVTSVFVPKRMFRQLSPGNPYAPSSTDGHHEEVRPTQVALSLLSCREQLASYWVELVSTRLSTLTQPPTLESAADANATATNATGSPATIADKLLSPGEIIADKQLLLGIATKLAARQMLKDLSLRPSCSHLHEWLQSYLLVQHADDLTAKGSVERLHSDLVRQPVTIRGGALVDPADLSLELFQRSMEILDLMEEDLRAAPEQVVPYTSSFLDSCLNL